MHLRLSILEFTLERPAHHYNIPLHFITLYGTVYALYFVSYMYILYFSVQYSQILSFPWPTRAPYVTRRMGSLEEWGSVCVPVSVIHLERSAMYTNVHVLINGNYSVSTPPYHTELLRHSVIKWRTQMQRAKTEQFSVQTKHEWEFLIYYSLCS